MLRSKVGNKIRNRSCLYDTKHVTYYATTYSTATLLSLSKPTITIGVQLLLAYDRTSIPSCQKLTHRSHRSQYQKDYRSSIIYRQSRPQFCHHQRWYSGISTSSMENVNASYVRRKQHQQPQPQQHRSIVTIRSSFDIVYNTNNSIVENSNHSTTITTTTSPPPLSSTTAPLPLSSTTTTSRMCYTRGWAWQTVLLQQRLHQKKEELQQQQVHGKAKQHYINDTILFLEHEPVYTLGRGADERHIKDLYQYHTMTTTSDNFHENKNDDKEAVSDTLQIHPEQKQDYIEVCRQRLSRQNMKQEQNNRSNTDKSVRNSLSTTSRLVMDGNIYQSYHLQYPLKTNIEKELHMVNVLCDYYIPKNPVLLPVSTSSLSPHISSLTTTTQRSHNIPIYRVERGGQITYHGPGQLIMYPIFDLASSSSNFKKDLHWFVHAMEQVFIDTTNEILQSYDPNHSHHVGRDDDNTGVWVTTNDSSSTNQEIATIKKYKIAAIGISASRWITSHGVCYNINPNLLHYDPIIPCGIMNNDTSTKSITDDHYDNTPINHDQESKQQGNNVEYGVTSLQQLLLINMNSSPVQQQQQNTNIDMETVNKLLSMSYVTNIVIKHMQRIFQFDNIQFGERIV